MDWGRFRAHRAVVRFFRMRALYRYLSVAVRFALRYALRVDFRVLARCLTILAALYSQCQLLYLALDLLDLCGALPPFMRRAYSAKLPLLLPA